MKHWFHFYHRKLSIGCITRGTRGFTLIEVLTAIMILAIAFVVIMELFSAALKSERISQQYVFAVFHAREKMEKVLSRAELFEESEEGEFDDGYMWKLDISPVNEVEKNGSPLVQWQMFDIRLDISWFDNGHLRHFCINTRQLAREKASDAS